MKHLLWGITLLIFVFNDFGYSITIKYKEKEYALKEVCHGRILVNDILKIFPLKIHYDFKSQKVLLEKDKSSGKEMAILVPDFNSLFLVNSVIELVEPPFSNCNNNATFSQSFIKSVLPKIVYPDFYSIEKEEDNEIKTKNITKEEIIATEYEPTNRPWDTVLAREGHEIKTVAIDPGHGGMSSGTSFGTIYEKDIVLNYAKELADILKKEYKLNVIMTRNEDVFVSLDERTKIANSSKADLFISIHVNYSPNKFSSGIETYILNTKASDDDAKKLALLENEIMADSFGFQSKTPNNNAVKDILWDMEQNIFLQESAVAASIIQNQLLDGLDSKISIIKNRGVKQAMFWVLGRVAMPALLVEIGFLSNAKDRSLVIDKKYRENFVKNLAIGLIKYKNLLLKGKVKTGEKND